MYANITQVTEGAHNFAAELRAAGVRVQRYGPPVVRASAKELQEAVKRNASLPAEGPPGPRKITGEYLKSIKISTSGISGAIYASQAGRFSQGFENEVYTDAPFGRRLELGFVGVDSLGRHYNQPPYPHWGPAIHEVEGPFFASMEYVVDSAFIGGHR